MRSLLALALMMVVAVVGCTAPSIGEYPSADRKAPKRSQKATDVDAEDDEDDEGDDTPGKGSTSSAATGPTTPAETGQALTIASTGGGQGDVTCNGGPCTATFAAGSTVTLAAAPKPGSFFSGWTGGGCTGSGPCSFTVGGAAPSAKFETFTGDWVGTYQNNRPNGGCNFQNSGNVTQAIGGAPGAYTAAVTAMNGLEIRNLNGCGLVDSRTGTAPAQSATIDGDTVTGVWNVQVAGIGGTLPFPFTAKLTGNKLTGTWTCPNCTGGFELTKQ
ncbi:MAG: hypothetical protein KIT84_19655 [Labilithrix sp.]|nr:hypothetical protein [Labilithrix sp.]MCW5813253.1 hypothetical protein [Labilithrix sp.]